MMSDSRLPTVANMFLRGLASSDAELVLSAVQQSAVLVADSVEHRGPALESWLSAHLADHHFDGRVVDRRWDKSALLLTLLVAEPSRARGLVRWALAVDGDRISRMVFERPRMPDLAPSVATFVRAVNDTNLEGIVSTFTNDALVNDELVDYWGRDAIASWVEQAVIGKRLALYVVDRVKHEGRLTLTCHATGDFEGLGLPDPLILSFYFSLRDDQIEQLIILPKQPTA